MMYLKKELDALPYVAKIILPIHDELLVECPKEHGEEIKTLLEGVMAKAGSVVFPGGSVTAEGEISDNWCK